MSPTKKPKPGTPEFRAQAKRRLAENRTGYVTTDPKERFRGKAEYEGQRKGARMRRTVSTGKSGASSIDIRAADFVSSGKAVVRRLVRKKKKS